MTKLTSRQRFAETLRRAWHALKFDPSFTAGKKVTADKKQEQDDELNEAAANQEVFATKEVEELIQEVSAPTQVSQRSGETVLERVTKGAKRFVTVSAADRALWESVVARRVYDLDSGELLAAEEVANVPKEVL